MKRPTILCSSMLVALVALPCIGGSNADIDAGPCVDFYAHVNGEWIQTATIPDDRGRYSNYDEAREKTAVILEEIIEEAVEGGERRSEALRAIGSFFSSCMAEDERERRGVEPLRDLLSKIEAIETKADLSRTLGELHRIGVRVPFRLESSPAPSDAGVLIAEVDQSGMQLSLPEVYAAVEGDGVAEVAAYRTLAESMFRRVAPEDRARDEAALAVGLERTFAARAMSVEERRNPRATTSEMSWEALGGLLAELDLETYREALGIDVPKRVNVRQPKYLEGVDETLGEDGWRERWRAYLTLHLLYNASLYLDRDLREARFRFDAKRTGVTEIPATREACLRSTRGFLSELIGWEYAQRVVPGDARDRVSRMAENLKAAFATRLEESDWLSEPTRKEALAKLSRMKISLFGPSRAPEIVSVSSDASYFQNVVSLATAELDSALQKIGKPVDRDAWPIPSYSTSAGYLPDENRIILPATKFLPPFFDSGANDASNYGSIGATIAHEMIHGFDDEGRHYDATGNVRDWWSEEDAKHFEERSASLVAQFDAYRIADGLDIDGRRTLGENIADLGGLVIAYEAFNRQLGLDDMDEGTALETKREFFRAWARHWRVKYRDAYLADLVRTDVHAPTPWRVNGSVSNLEEFSKAFGCVEGDPMRLPPAQRTRLWW